MKFKYSVSPNYNHNVTTKQIMNDVAIALMFVSLCSVFLQFSSYGIDGVIRALLIIMIAVATCYGVDYLYWKMIKVKEDKLKTKVSQNVPAITGMILALALPLGSLDSMQMLYVTFISAIVAELFGKLIYGGFGYNIFNPAGVGRAFALLAFGKYLIIPKIDGLTGASPLAVLQQNDLSAVNQTFNGYSSLLIGSHQGSLGETMVIPLLIAAVYLIYKNVIDWTIPVFSVLTIAVLAAITSSFNMEYVAIHVLSGGLIFGAVFMLTDPVTNPINRQGKMIFAIVFALITFLIRTKASLPEGVVFSILIVNMLVPMIDKFTANVTDKDVNKKVISIVATLVIAIIITVLFQQI